MPKNIQRKIIEIIELLALEPRPVGVVKLSATENLYRVRTGDYRIIYKIQDKFLLIVITKVGHRRDVYIINDTYSNAIAFLNSAFMYRI
ncbi:hypothetical protein H1P_5470002 [Hyella patelloides LEGE 07179]|uniref:Uncharacterized protein n=1 Tax=Hyella patelloides LEGE 07179 TaxID=945734 RepID=A0A563W082_9CYAN|nr:type II toxin-antitoxin system RelE/ParE family toxin [Hyella patelloides]VEP17086.1 hypothetical protein H1P_5470002 [Hyella patelloides LEGE 07179]